MSAERFPTKRPPPRVSREGYFREAERAFDLVALEEMPLEELPEEIKSFISQQWQSTELLLRAMEAQHEITRAMIKGEADRLGVAIEDQVLSKKGGHVYVSLPARYLMMVVVSVGLTGVFSFAFLYQLIGAPVLHWTSLLYGVVGSLGLLGTVLAMIAEIGGISVADRV